MWKSIKDLVYGIYAIGIAGFVIGAFTAAFLLPVIAAWKFVTTIMF